MKGHSPKLFLVLGVTPAKAGVRLWRPEGRWIPAFAGMTASCGDDGRD